MTKKKLATIIGSIFMVPTIINKAVFTAAKIKYKKELTGEFYNWNLGDIYYNVYGSGRPILLIHGIGLGCSQQEWAQNIEELSKHYKVYALDLLGFGNSHKPNMTYTSYMYSTLINDFIDDVIKRPVAVVTSTNSANIALIAYTNNPKNMKRLLMIEPKIMNNPLSKNSDVFFRNLLTSPILGTSIYNIMGSKFGVKKFTKENLFFAADHPYIGTLIEDLYSSAHMSGAKGKFSIGCFISKFININTLHLLEKVTIPTAVVWGEESTLNTINNMEYITRIRPDFQFAVFEETRSMPHYENHIEFNNLVKEFFK